MRKKLYELGLDLLKRGYDIVAHESDTYYHVTDGVHVLCLQNQYFKDVSMSFPYKPTQGLGGSCRVGDGVDSVGDVIRFFKELKNDYSMKTLYKHCDMLYEKRAEPELYKTFNEWFADLWDKDQTTMVTTEEQFKELFTVD